MAFLQLVAVRKVYRAGAVDVVALDGVTLAIERGEFVSIMGPSGSGKSTLLHILGCLDRPTSGQYRVDGVEVSRLGDDRLADLRNRVFGFVFQTFHLLPQLTARENVELPLVYRGVPAAQRRRRAEEALAAVGLADRMHHRPGQLSGGQQQRVAIARALVAEPAAILADEPTGNLDSRSGAEVMALFQELNERRGITVIQVTHDEEMARHGRRLVRMRDGRVVADAPVERPLRAAERLAELAQAAGAAAGGGGAGR